MTAAPDWKAFRAAYLEDAGLGIALDLSRAAVDPPEGAAPPPDLEAALDAMAALEQGGVANPDEGRQVGHYWLRDPDLAPDAATAAAIRDTVAAVTSFAADVQTGRLTPPGGGHFRDLLLIGIGGSALGPQLADAVLATPDDPLRFHCLDNTDPEGFSRTLERLGNDLGRTLVVVVSKSGGTKETRNGMLAARAAWSAAGRSFPRQAVAVTGPGSELDVLAETEGWLRRFPLPDWVGGRTSQTSVVGLLPMALAGHDVDAFLDGARRMDAWTRSRPAAGNPAARMALAWHHLAGGRGARQMVVLPYRDRLERLSRYLQQLIMESLGKEKDLRGRTVHQGLTVYGNKGSTDQHAYVQQLRDGRDDIFVTFVRVLEDGGDAAAEVEPGVTAGDYLDGFLLGTRQALFEKGRGSLTLTLQRLDAATLGAIIALFERTVGLYASLVGINAYHQPGVEAGKRAAGEVIRLQARILAHLAREPGRFQGAAEIAAGANAAGEVETVFHVLRHLAAQPFRGVTRRPGSEPGGDTFALAAP